MLRVLDLFSGIGGFSLGLERAGMRTVAFCEIDPYCRAVLRKHWPAVIIWDDIRTLDTDFVNTTHIDVICGGFPCQDVSVAGKRAGLEGKRSGLWVEFARIIGDLRPGFVIVENTPGLLSLGIGTVLGDLASLGYDAQWRCIRASDVGADHLRERVWIVAYPHRKGLQERFMFPRIQGKAQCNDYGENIAVGAWRSAEPAVVRRLHGIPARVDRIRALGNAVVPQIPEIIGRAIMAAQ
jgi:DNA (cytosine-5)-methyltransferase 1